MKASSSVTLERPERPDQSPERVFPAPRRIRRTVARSIANKGVLSLFDQVVVSGTSFATSVIIGRMCSQGEFGIYYLAFTIVLVLRAVQANVISIPYTIYCNRRQGDALASYAASTVVHYAVLSLLAVAGLFGLIGVLSLGLGPANLAPAVWVLLGVLPFLLLREFIRYFTFAHLRLARSIAVDLSVAVVQLGGLLLLAYFGKLSVQTAYLAIGVACGVACLGWFLANDRPLHFRPARVVVDWVHNWSFGRWALASQLACSASMLLFPWILVLAHGESSTGVLAACASLVGVAGMFVNGLGNVITPRAARAFAGGGVAELRRVLRNTSLVFLFILGVFCLLILFAGNFLAVLVYGPEYAGVGPVVTILAFGILVESLGITAKTGLWAMEQPSTSFAADLTDLAVGLAAAACLIVPYGVLGAAVGTLAGISAAAAVRWITLWRLMKSPSYHPAVA